MDHDVQARDGTKKPDSRGRLFTMLYVPWTWLVFIPFLILSTLVLGIAAVSLCAVSPNWAFHCGTVWSWCLCRMNFTRVRVLGRHLVGSGQAYVIMSNHQSHFDVPAFYGHWGRQHRWVLKKELKKIPVFGWYGATGGHIYVDRSNRTQAVEDLKGVKNRIGKGVSIMIFPEGTRSPDGRLQPFKKGGFMLALELGLPILPVSLSGSRNVLPPGSLKLSPGRITIQIHSPVDAKTYGLEGRDRLMEDVQAVIASGLTLSEQSAS